MILLATDEDFDNRVLSGLLLRKPELDILRVQDTELSGMKDPVMLEWAAQTGRVLLTHDKNTISKYAYERVRNGQPMPGVIMVKRFVPIGLVIEDVLILLELTSEGEWVNQVKHVPM